MISSGTITVSEDIQLVPPVAEDAKEMFRVLDKNRDYLRVWLPFVDYTQSQKDSEDFLAGIPQSGEIVYVIRYKGIFAGLIGLKSPDSANAKVEIGYWLNPAYEGKGLVTLSCKALIRYAFDELQMNRILIQVAVENLKSRRIPERLGFTEEGIERDGELLVAGYTDIVRYGLLKREFDGNN